MKPVRYKPRQLIAAVSHSQCSDVIIVMMNRGMYRMRNPATRMSSFLSPGLVMGLVTRHILVSFP